MNKIPVSLFSYVLTFFIFVTFNLMLHCLCEYHYLGQNLFLFQTNKIENVIGQWHQNRNDGIVWKCYEFDDLKKMACYMSKRFHFRDTLRYGYIYHKHHVNIKHSTKPQLHMSMSRDTTVLQMEHRTIRCKVKGRIEIYLKCKV